MGMYLTLLFLVSLSCSFPFHFLIVLLVPNGMISERAATILSVLLFILYLSWDLGTWDQKPGTWETGPGTCGLGLGTWELRPGT